MSPACQLSRNLLDMPAVIRQTRNLDDSYHEFLTHPAPRLLIAQFAGRGG